MPCYAMLIRYDNDSDYDYDYDTIRCYCTISCYIALNHILHSIPHHTILHYVILLLYITVHSIKVYVATPKSCLLRYTRFNPSKLQELDGPWIARNANFVFFSQRLGSLLGLFLKLCLCVCYRAGLKGQL